MKVGKIMTSRGEVVAIGEFKIRNSDEFPYEIPRLSYIIINEAEKTFASTCIDLHIDGDGTTPEEAEKNMGENVFEFLQANFAKDRSNGPAWDYLYELTTIDENSKETWDAFSKFKLYLAQEGIKADFASELMERVDILKNEIDRLNNLNTNKKKQLNVLTKWINSQRKEIEKLEQEKRIMNAEKALLYTGVQMLRNFEIYNSNWSERR